MPAIHLLSCDEHSAEVLRDAAVELGLPLMRGRKPPRTKGCPREIVIIDGDRGVEAREALEASKRKAICIGLLGEAAVAHELLAAGADLILHKPVFSEWAKICLMQACCEK